MKVKDWMSKKVVTVEPTTSVKKAYGLMKQNGFHHLPVVKGDRVVGIVTDRDLRRPDISDIFKEWAELYRLNDDIHVEDVMATPVVTVTPETDLLAAASILIEKKFNALPVVDGQGRLCGIITTVDFLKGMIRGR